MQTAAIGHAEFYVYPERVTPHDTIVSPQRIDVMDLQMLVEVLGMMPAETSFSVLLVINECVVGNGKYIKDHATISILHEYGACVGFLAKPLALLREAHQQQAE
jgi:hypothetical protein